MLLYRLVRSTSAACPRFVGLVVLLLSADTVRVVDFRAEGSAVLPADGRDASWWRSSWSARAVVAQLVAARRHRRAAGVALETVRQAGGVL